MHPLREAVKRDGYVLVPGVLAEDEVTAARDAIKRHMRRAGVTYGYASVQPDAAAAIPDLSWLFVHNRVLDAVRRVLGREDIVFTRHADAHVSHGSDWHKDDGSGGALGPTGYFGAPQHVQACEVYKMGIYLEDHATGGGLTVQPGTHLQPDVSAPATYLASRAGDAVLFDVRITHRGVPNDQFESALLAIGRALGDSDGASRLGRVARNAYRRVRGFDPKHSLFFTFGAPNDLTEAFAASNLDRQRRQGAADLPLPEALLLDLERAGVRLAAAAAQRPPG